MKLDRDKNSDGLGKYALIKLRRLENFRGPGTFDGFGAIGKALETLDKAGMIEWGLPNTEGEFFVIKLRDCHAAEALIGYAASAERGIYSENKTLDVKPDAEWAAEVRKLVDRSGTRSPFCKKPD